MLWRPAIGMPNISGWRSGAGPRHPRFTRNLKVLRLKRRHWRERPVVKKLNQERARIPSASAAGNAVSLSMGVIENLLRESIRDDIRVFIGGRSEALIVIVSKPV